MILSIDEIRKYITSDKSDSEIATMLQSLELLVRQYTHNNFQLRAVRSKADVYTSGSEIDVYTVIPVSVGDTLQISESAYMPDMLCTISGIEGTIITVNESLYNENQVIVTKVVYPQDVKQGVVNMLKWDLENRGKVGIQSEAISRHSVTYFNMDGDNSTMGYPRSLLGFLVPYKKARF